MDAVKAKGELGCAPKGSLVPETKWLELGSLSPRYLHHTWVLLPLCQELLPGMSRAK